MQKQNKLFGSDAIAVSLPLYTDFKTVSKLITKYFALSHIMMDFKDLINKSDPWNKHTALILHGIVEFYPRLSTISFCKTNNYKVISMSEFITLLKSEPKYSYS